MTPGVTPGETPVASPDAKLDAKLTLDRGYALYGGEGYRARRLKEIEAALAPRVGRTIVLSRERRPTQDLVSHLRDVHIVQEATARIHLQARDDAELARYLDTSGGGAFSGGARGGATAVRDRALRRLGDAPGVVAAEKRCGLPLFRRDPRLLLILDESALEDDVEQRAVATAMGAPPPRTPDSFVKLWKVQGFRQLVAFGHHMRLTLVLGAWGERALHRATRVNVAAIE